MASCVEALLSSSFPPLYQLSLDDVKMLLRIGYEVQSEFIGSLIEDWLNGRTGRVADFIYELILCDFIWKSTSFSRFEMRILARLPSISDDLLTRLKRKLATCDLELPSLKNVLRFAIHTGGNSQATRHQELQTELRQYMNRCGAFMENLFKKDEVSDEVWDIIPDFVTMAADIDLGKWLGFICKRDLEDINPRGSRAIMNVLARDSHAYHRSLPGWLARTFSRFTRRFAEDLSLSETTLTAVQDFGIAYFKFKSNVQTHCSSLLKATKIPYVWWSRRHRTWSR